MYRQVIKEDVRYHIFDTSDEAWEALDSTHKREWGWGLCCYDGFENCCYKPLYHDPTQCCGYKVDFDSPYPVFYNPFNRSVQCHNCGSIYRPKLGDRAAVNRYPKGRWT